ncbi:hypothetical protein DICVIV_00236 [Dictyocaulus viviparus]|uniref:Calcineurin-like phosphoesterase domain-containing protein n=1 Tax=Dictyocaulus viviparus TaxID=29172 RepID=A0A0D8Y9H1_DICVI|nr:hypothetical protein DICVIV_00236 [Dictyocaulus viviparus]
MPRWSPMFREEVCVVSMLLRRCSTAANSATVYRPPYYRKPHKHHEPRHMLEEEFPASYSLHSVSSILLNAGDVSGAGVRLFDYYKTAELVNQFPTIKEKIDFVSPYERPWTKAEKTWRRAWHPSLMSTRKAWALPLVPKYFDCMKYYQYITKTRIVESSLDSYYAGLNPPIASYEKAAQESLFAILSSDRFETEDERVSAILAALVDDAIYSVVHNVPRFGDCRIAYDVQSESFWIRSGFMFLYDTKPIGSDTVVRNLRTATKFTGDDRRKLGELAFVSRDRLAVQMRTREPLSPLHSLESEEATRPLFPEEVDVTNDVLFPPKVMNLWPDENPLWQCPGYFVESEETHVVGRVGAKSLYWLDEQCKYWDAPPEESWQMWEESAKAQAVASLFTTLCAQAHTAGFTQYTDITRPFTSQLILSNGVYFMFAVGQLNTIAINIECDGFENPKTNLCQLENPINFFFNSYYREWQMYRSYKSAVYMLSPDAVFFLGDLMDEGQWGDSSTFARYADRFESLFSTSSNEPEVHVLAGNHDLGFHYAISPYRVKWFQERFNRTVVDTVNIKGHHFILVTSMALHGDGCRFCYEAEVELEKLAVELNCSIQKQCHSNISSRFLPFRRPILLQHFPLFRPNDNECLRDDDFDYDDKTRNEIYRSGWEALSQESTLFLIHKLQPRAVFNGHTHRGCKKRWIKPIEFWEYTVNSFSWRNGNRPSFLMATITRENVTVGVCHLPCESTVLYIYAITAVTLVFWMLNRAHTHYLRMSNKFRHKLWTNRETKLR